MEIDLDRYGDIHININAFKLIMEDTHKKSKIADPFRVIFLLLQNIDDPF
jgi:hypothetical protein